MWPQAEFRNVTCAAVARRAGRRFRLCLRPGSGRADGTVVNGGIEPQTRQVLENVKAALALAGATMDDVVKTTVWLEDARDFGGIQQGLCAPISQGAAGAHDGRKSG